jgi:hypothetical protein
VPTLGSKQTMTRTAPNAKAATACGQWLEITAVALLAGAVVELGHLGLLPGAVVAVGLEVAPADGIV